MSIKNITIPSVRQMVSPRLGNPVANQFIISTDAGEFFQSYRTVIAFNNNGQIYLDENWNWSVTTLKYLKEFLPDCFSKDEIYKAIEEGYYKLTDLN